jgi:membrane protein
MAGSRAWAFAKTLANAWTEDEIARKAAALAYYTVFSIAPLLVIVIAVVGLFVDSGAAANAIVSETRSLVGEEGAGLLEGLLSSMHEDKKAGIAAIVAFIVALVGATTVFAELKDSLDQIWGVQAKAPTGLWGLLRSRLLSFGLVLVLAFLLLVSLAVNAALAVLSGDLARWFGIEGAVAVGVLGFVVAMLVVTGMFAAIYKLLPEVELAWKEVVGAALLTAVLFSIGRFAIGLYLGNSAPASSFGAAGSLAVLLLWVYYSAIIFFLGAEVTRHLLTPERQQAAVARHNPATQRALDQGSVDPPRERGAAARPRP